MGGLGFPSLEPRGTWENILNWVAVKELKLSYHNGYM